MTQRAILRRVSPRGLMLVSLMGAKPVERPAAVRSVRLLLSWADRAFSIVRRLDADASRQFMARKPLAAAQRAYSIKAGRSRRIMAGVRTALQKVEDTVVEMGSAI